VQKVLCSIWLLFVATSIAWAQPRAAFNASPNKGCSPATIQFNNQSTGTSLTYLWDFGNGNTSTIKSPQAIYYASGFYTVKLIVKDNTGSIDSSIRVNYIEIFKNPVADFSAAATSGCIPFNPGLIDQSIRGSAMITDWVWDYNDGKVISGKNPSHAYTQPGIYDISLLVKDANGCQEKTVKTKYLTVKEAPQVLFIADKLLHCALPATVNFTNKSIGLKSSDTYYWDFGDGTGSNNKDAQKTYTTYDDFDVTLTVTSANGCVTTAKNTDFIVISTLKPAFTYTPAQICENGTVDFVNTTTPKGFSYACTWDFGDGQTGTGKNPQHQYKSKGKYSVTLTVSLTDGTCKQTTTITDAIEVVAKPVAKFTVSDTALCGSGFKDTLIDVSTGGVNSYWFLNDVYISSGKGIILNIKKKFNNKIMLISGNGQCYDTLIDESAIYVDTLIANINIEPDSGCVPLPVNFSSSTSSRFPILSRLWDLGDGSYQTAESFDYQYILPGRYPITFIVSTGTGCTDTVKWRVKVGTKTLPSFSYPLTTKCNLDTIKITNAKHGKGVVDSWTWYLGGSKIGSGKTLNYKVKQFRGLYDIKLVTKYNGCEDSFIIDKVVRVNPPLAQYEYSYDLCKVYPYRFINTTKFADTITWVFDDSSTIVNEDTIYVMKEGDPWPLQLWAKNDSFQCTDFIDIVVEQHSGPYMGINVNGGNCVPANMVVSNVSNGYDNFNWKWSDESQTINNSSYTSRRFTVAGKYSITLFAQNQNGCKDTAMQEFTLFGSEVKSEVSPKSGCGQFKIRLVNQTSDPNILKKYWIIGGLDTFDATADTMFYDLKKPGPIAGGGYLVTFYAKDKSGCLNSKTDTVWLSGLNFHFKVYALATCAYPTLSISPSFSAAEMETRNITCYWDYGDGRTFTGNTVNYFYKEEGSYKLTLKAIDASGCINERDTILTNNFKTIKADLSADVLEATCPPLKVGFVSKSKSNFGPIVKYRWEFGDGSFSSLATPEHVYLKAGKFSVTLTVTNAAGCSDVILYKDLILIDGPIGSYTFDKKEGCSPLTVNYNATVTNAQKMEWDMGDGAVLSDTLQLTHIYPRVGKYTPMLVLTDSFGCKYTLPPVGTIEVFPDPLPNFSYSTPCLNQYVSFNNLSVPQTGIIKSCLWNFGDGDTSSSLNPSHVFRKSGSFQVTLTVWNTAGCSGTLTQTVTLKTLTAQFNTDKGFYCSGQVPKLSNVSVSDTTINTFSWFINDSLFSVKKQAVLPSLKSGVYKIVLAVKDNFGCLDTFKQQPDLIIGDTFAPVSPFIYRVSVENDESVVLDYSGYRSFDFKQYTIYGINTLGESTKLFTNTIKNDSSSILKSLNTLHNVYCYKVTATNLCGYESSLDLALMHCTVENKATGGIRKIDVTWNAYKGWPVLSYEVYREDINFKGDYRHIATVDGNTLLYVDTSIYCKISQFYRIKAIENGGHKQISWSDTSAARPSFNNAVPANHTIRATVDFDKEVTIEWTGSGTPRIPIREYVIEKSEDGVRYKWHQSFGPEQLSFTDKNVLVDEKSYFYRTYAIDTCELRSQILDFAKTILLTADTTVEERPYVTWSTYKGWNDGVNFYEVQRKKPDGSFVTIGNSNSDDTLMVDNITDLNGYPFYCYRVIGYKNSGPGQKQIISISNEDCAPVRSRIFAANSFTINGDGLNETFDIKGLYIKNYHISIFNRWGEQVFESNDMNKDWDGYYKGELCQMDAYIWIINALGVDDVKWPMTGTVTIIR
jgi:gliding motility-associated-like protein